LTIKDRSVSKDREFRPAIKDGQPVEVEMLLVIQSIEI
jgi:hypothetical protein